MRRRTDDAAGLRRRVGFLERAALELTAARDEEAVIELAARAAIEIFADACWIFVLDAPRTPRLARAAQAPSAKGVARMPGDLPARVARLALRGRRAAAEDGAVALVPMEYKGDVPAVMAVVPARSPRGSFTLLSESLARHAAAALIRVRAHAEMGRAIRIRDDAFAAAAHELGNSLGALSLQIRAMVSRIAETTPAPPALARLHSMERQVAELIGLSRRMLDTSRLSLGAFVVKRERLDLSAVVRNVLAREAEQLAWRRCRLDYDDPGPIYGHWDRGLLEQIVSNLVSNAVKYGHGHPISVTLEVMAGQARLEVEDYGIGIATADHQRIFEKFERAAPIEKGTSLGIGLWLVREMVAALGGTVAVRSTLGEGATFVVQLPTKRQRRAPRRKTP